MSDFVTATPSIVGFTNGYGDRGNYQHAFNYGISDKDQMFAVDIEANERTRDLLAASALNGVAIEKTGAAGVLATEKTGYAAVLESAKNAAALQLQSALNTSNIQMQIDRAAAAAALAAADTKATLAAAIAECCCETKVQIADVKATVIAIDAQRIRDDLAEARLQLIAIRSGGNPVVFAGK